ncbi:MAG: InlB B-repeat-containing protein [Treponema sp.]|nr:InlB B-repeat-containing protein [Candidatus Treponema equifaecale]
MKLTSKNIFQLFLILPFLFSCSAISSVHDDPEPNPPAEETPDNPETPDDNDEDDPDNPTTPVTPPTPTKSISDQFFWGTWVRMDNGEEYLISETSVQKNGEDFAVQNSSETKLNVNGLGSFEKQSDSVIISNFIPYFRKGGANLEYTLKLVGFEENVSRASASSSLKGYKASGTSEKFSSFKTETESDENGTIKLTAPISGDVQTVTVTNDSEVIVVPGITVKNSGDYLGTVPVGSDGSYILKVTGEIPESEKNDGYMYANNYKSYPLTLTVTNVSEVSSSYSLCKITSDNNNLKISSSENISEGIAISTLKPGMTKTINLEVSFGALNEGYVNTGLNVEITNGSNNRTWVDYVPLRFYRGLLPVTIAAKSTENNPNASLNGFIVYPDGNSKFFQVSENSTETIYVPTFMSTESYLFSFCGATVEGTLSDSTEMFYTVAVGSKNKKEILTTGTNAFSSFQYGEPNENENTAFRADSEFQAYIGDGEIDYFKIAMSSENIESPSGTSFFNIRFATEHSAAPESFTKEKGEIIYQSELPKLETKGYVFDGWKLNGNFFTQFEVTRSVSLSASWTPVVYSIGYELNGGRNDFSNIDSYTIENAVSFEAPSRAGYTFDEWYLNADFSGSKITGINKGSVGEVKLYAKWTANTDTSYVVRHYRQNILDDEYTLFESENLSGITDTNTAANAKNYTGFNSLDFEQINISGNGSSVLNIYYDRKIITLTFDLDGGTSETELTGNKLSGKYGANIVFAEPKKACYKFVGWNSAGETLPELFATDKTYKALWAGSGIVCTVSSLSDITVVSTQNGSTISFVADSGYDSYIWSVDDVKQSSVENSFDFDTSALPVGTYEIVLLAKNSTSYRSATIFVEKK